MKKAVPILASLAALGAAGALAVRGRRNHPAWKTLRAFRYAHRGYHDKPQIPENSMPAFRRALARGWGAELDVHLLRDGTLAVFHDSELRRCTGAEGVVEEHTRQSLSALRLEGTDQPIPLFDEVLALFEGKAPLIIELKTRNGNHNALAKAVCERLDSYRGDFCIESFDPRAIRAVKKLRPGICRGVLSMNFLKSSEVENLPLWQKAALKALLLNFLAVPDFVAYQQADRNNIFLRLCKKLWGVQEVSWTIRSPEALAACEKAGSIPIFEKFDPDSLNRPE